MVKKISLVTTAGRCFFIEENCHATISTLRHMVKKAMDDLAGKARYTGKLIDIKTTAPAKQELADG